MKRLKHKILLPTIAAISTIAIVAPLSIAIPSKVVATNNSSIVNSINYTTITYNTDSGTTGGQAWTITLQGPSKVKAEIGDPFGSVQRPRPVHSLNWKFKGWSTEPQATYTDDDIIADGKEVPDPSVETWSLYPVFEVPALLSNCLCVSAIEANTVTINFQSNPTNDPVTNANRDRVHMEYSTDFGAHWDEIKYNTTTRKWSINLAQGTCLYLKGNNPSGLSDGADNYTHITFSDRVNLFGNAMGLVDNGALITSTQLKAQPVPNAYCFYHLFENQSNITYVADNFFPSENAALVAGGVEANTLKAHCYEGAFLNCSGMEHCPRLFATNTAVIGADGYDTTECYKDIFKGCSKIDFVRTRYSDTVAAAGNNQFKDWVTDAGSTAGCEFIYDGTSSVTDFGFNANWSRKKTPNDTTYKESGEIDFYDIEITNTDLHCTADHPYTLTKKVTKNKKTVEEEPDLLTDVIYSSADESIASIDHINGTITGKPFIGNASKEVKISIYSKANLNANNYQTFYIDPITIGNCTGFTNNDADHTAEIYWTYVGSTPTGGLPNFKYTIDGGATWLESVMDTKITVPKGGTIYFKGNNPGGLSSGSGSFTNFITPTGSSFKLTGDIRSLIEDGLNPTGTTVPCDYCFNNLFAGANITEVDSGYLPYTTLTEGCYSGMFRGCTQLTTIASDLLPAETMTENCYARMFYGCSLLENPCALNAMTLAKSCYQAMFYECYALKATVKLPATTPAESCYAFMFQDCTSVPSNNGFKEVSLTSFTTECCFQMFCNNDLRSSQISRTATSKKIITIPSGAEVMQYKYIFGTSIGWHEQEQSWYLTAGTYYWQN